MAYKLNQKVVGLRGERDVLAVPREAALRDVQRHRAEPVQLSAVHHAQL
jgi:hypothetical protein